MKIYVDSDACPVKDEIVRVAERHNLIAVFVSNQLGRLPNSTCIERMIVAEGPDVADDWIAERIGTTDICVTQDIPLAKRCLEAGAQAIGPTGRAFDEASIGMALAVREIRQFQRETGQGGSHNAAFRREDRSRFLQALENAVQAVKRRTSD